MARPTVAARFRDDETNVWSVMTPLAVKHGAGTPPLHPRSLKRPRASAIQRDLESLEISVEIAWRSRSPVDGDLAPALSGSMLSLSCALPSLARGALSHSLSPSLPSPLAQ